jgi:ATP-binding cassette, subfamily F, member 3
MSVLIQANNIKKAYGPQLIFSGASFTVSLKQKIGVIGRNGAGKSTLFNMLIGEEKPDSGELSIHDQARIGHLRQEDDFKEDDIVLSYLAEKSGREDWRCAKMASHFELKNELLAKRVLDLSGGYQMRVKLSLMLLKEPNLLLLDEPTNYLDLSTTLLLEKFLIGYQGAYLIISHDRRFIKNTCKETLDIENGTAYHYPGGLESYLAFKKEKLLITHKYNKKQVEKQKHLQKFIDRFGAKASLAAQAKSKAKQIKRIKTIDIENTLGSAVIKIPRATEKQGMAFEIDGLAIGYKDNVVASGIKMEIRRGEHLALLGDNGQGKSTFMKTLAGQLPAIQNPLRLSKNLRLAYYAQHSAGMLNPKDTVESYLVSCAIGNYEYETICRMAGDFLFSEDDIKKPISVLSGGEKARLCLAGIFLSAHDILLLDEPTNHLDFETAEALAMALAESNATVIFISHDRTFTSLVADNILEVKNRKIKRLYGDYEDYLESLPAHAMNQEIVQSSQEEIKEEKKKKFSEAKQLKKDTMRLERQLEKLNKEKLEILEYFEKNQGRPAPQKSARLKELEDLIVENEEAWLDLATLNNAA